MKRWWALAAILLVSTGQAITSEFRLLLDLDSNLQTGCTVNTPAGVFAGVDSILLTRVETDGLDQASVVAIERSDCLDGSFGAPQTISSGGWPVGLGNGDDGFNVIETFLPIDLGQSFRDVRIGLVASDELGNESVLLTRAPDSTQPILLFGQDPLPVPFLNFWLHALLAVLLLGLGAWLIGRRGRLTLTALVCLSAGGVAGAACLMDGEIFDWSLADRLAQGSAQDPESGVDLRSLYGKVGEDGQSLCFRIDSALVFAIPPQAADDDYLTIETTPLAVAAADGLLANDALGLPDAELVTFGGGDLGGGVQTHAAGSTVPIGADGSLTVQADGSFEFQAASGFEGDFSFDYRIENLAGFSDGTVLIEVQSVPVAADDAYSVRVDATLVEAAPGVLANDAGLPTPLVTSFGGGDLGGSVDDHPAGSELVLPAAGSLRLDADGALNFQPPTDASGDFQFEYRIDNAAGSATALVTITVNVPPQVVSADTWTCQAGQSCQFQFLAEGFPEPEISLTGNLPDGIDFDSLAAELTGTPALGGGGLWPLEVVAANGVEPDAVQAFELTINEAPLITSADAVGCQVAQPCGFTFTASGFPAPEFDLPGLPAGLALDPVTGVLSGTPDAGTGDEYNLTLAASNGIDPDASQALTLTIGQAPAITSADSLVCEVGQSCSFTFTATGFPAPGFDLPGLPAGLDLDPVTGLLSGTPDSGTGNAYALVLTASNGIDPDASQNFSLTINEAPEITSGASLICQVGQPCDFTFTASGFPAPEFELPGLPAGLDLDPVTGVLSGSPAAGTGDEYALTLTAGNGINPDASQAFALTINQAPAITSADSLVCEVGQSCSFTFTATGFPAPSFDLPGLPAGLDLDPVTGLLSGTPDSGTGNAYALVLTASNGIDPDASQNFSLTINEAPTITSANSLGCEVGQACSLTVTADGFPAPGFALPGLPAGLALDPVSGVISGSPAAGTGGEYNLTLEASNGIAPDASQAFTLTIGQAPQITSNDSLTCEVGQACDFTLAATGFPAPSFTLPGLPAGLNLDPVSGVISGSPDAGTGALYELTVEASNSVGIDSQAFALTINEAPTINSGASLSCEINQPCSFQFLASGFPAPQFGLPGLPAGLILDPVSGALSGTPDPGAAGNYSLTLTASNGVNPDATQAFSIQVGAPPVITSSDNFACTVGQACSFDFTASGVPAPVIDLVGGLPAGVSFDAGSASLGGTPDAGSGGSYLLAVEASNGFLPDDSQTFTLTINEAPVAVDDPAGGIPANSAPGDLPYHVALNTTMTVTAAAGVLANDTLGFPAAIITTPSPVAGNGSVSLAADGSFVYTPDTDFVGIDSFEYCIENAAATDCAQVSLAVGLRPAASDATYPATLVGNVAIDTTRSSGFSVADLATGDQLSFALVSANGGDAVLNANGTFEFNPTAGLTSASGQLLYSASNGFGSVQGTVDIPIGSGRVWFVDNAGANGDGRLGSPFNSLVAVQGASAAGDAIFLYSGSGDYTGGITLLANQRLIGQGASSALATLAGLSPPADSLLPSTGGGRPQIANAGGIGVGLNAGNQLHGFNVGATSDHGINGNSLGSLVVRDVSVLATGPALQLADGTVDAQFDQLSAASATPATAVSLSNLGGNLSVAGGSLAGGSNGAILIEGGDAVIAYGGNITQSGGGQRTVHVFNRTGGSVTFTGQIQASFAGATAVDLVNNTGSTITFAGGLQLSTGNSPAFMATGGGTINVCDDNPCNPAATGPLVNALTTTTARALDVRNTTIGANHLEFRSITAGTPSAGPDHGIYLENTGTSGGLKIRGTGTSASGGTIQRTSVSGIRLLNGAQFDADRLVVTTSAAHGIHATNVLGFALRNSSVINNGDAVNEQGLWLVNPAGAIVLANVTATGNASNNVFIVDGDNNGGAVNLTVLGGTYSSNHPTTGNHGMLIEVAGSAVWGPSLIESASFSDNRSLGLQVVTGGNAQLNGITIDGSQFAGNATASGQQIGLDVAKAGMSTLTATVRNNSFLGHNSHAMNFFSAAGPGTGGNYNARIENNVVGDAGVVDSGSRIGNCMRIVMQGDSVDRVLVDGNVLRQCPLGRGIEAISRNGTGGADFTITNNTAIPDDSSGFPLAGIFVQSNAVTIPNSLRANIFGNTVPVGSTFDIVNTYLGLVGSNGAGCQLVGTAANPTAQLVNTNTGSASAGATCTLIPGPITTPP